MPPLPSVKDHRGTERPLGCLLRVPTGISAKILFRRFREVLEPIPRDQWEITPTRRRLANRVMDQDGVGSCNAEAATQGLEMVREYSGQFHIPLSPGCLYGQINGGQDGGSYLGDALKALIESGTTPESIIPHLEWRQSRWPSDWRDHAKKYRILEAYDCPTFDEIATAVQCGYLVDLGIMVGNNFHPASDGWLPDYTGGSGGHAMCGIDLCYKEGRGWGIGTLNSWSPDWGLNGYCVIPESYFQQWWNDCWCVRAAVEAFAE